MISDIIYDIDRNVTTPAREYYFYPYWDEIPEIINILRAAKNSIWRDAPKSQELYEKLKKNKFLKTIVKPLLKSH
jgi:hypothetical protein